MLISGSQFRSLAERDNLSWRAYLTVSGSNTGRAVFGFSGEGKTVCFTFDDGKILDPENRFFAGYHEGVAARMISGNISNTGYNYYYGGQPYCFAGVKPDFKIQNFFAQTTGCSLNTDVWVFGDPFEFSIGYQTGFTTGQALTGRLTSVDSNYKFKIFSGEVLDSSGHFSFSGFDTGNQSDAIITLSSTGNSSGTRPLAIYPIRTILHTNFGVIDHSFESTAFPEYPLDVDLSLIDITSVGEEMSGVSEQVAEHVLTYKINKGFSSIELTGLNDKPLHVSLQYSGGRTGDFYQVSGVELATQGSGYTSAPTALFFGHSHSKNTSYYHTDASGESLMSFSIAGVDITHSGKYYASNVSVSAVGAGGAGAIISGLVGDPNEATVSGKITGIKIENSGSGYSSAPSLVFVAPANSEGETASGTAILDGFLTGIKLTSSGLYHGNEPYFSGFIGGGGEGATASTTLKKYVKSFTGLWDLKTGYTMDSLVSYRAENKISGHRFDDKVPVYELFGRYWKDLRNACEKNEGTGAAGIPRKVHLTYSFMNSGTEVFDVYNYTGTVTDTLQDHYWSDRGYLVNGNPITTTAEFSGQVGEAFQEWKELIEGSFTGVIIEFKNLGFEGEEAINIPSPWPVYDPIYDCECEPWEIIGYTLRTGSYYLYSRAGASGESYNIGDFRIGMADHTASPGWLAFGFYPISYSNMLVNSETGAHMGDIMFDRKDPWMVGDDDSLVNFGFDIKQVAVHEIGHTLGLGHTDPNDLWSQESIMAPYGAVKQRFAGDFPHGLKSSAIDKAAIKRLYASGGYDDDWTGIGNGRQDDYSNLNNMYMNADPVYITGSTLSVVVEHDLYGAITVGASVVVDNVVPEDLNIFTGVGATGLFSKYVNIFGVPVLATSGTTDSKVSHAASVFAEYIDNNKDGFPDNESVFASMVDNKSVLLIMEDETEYTDKIEPHNHLWNNFGFKTYPLYSSEIDASDFDHSLEKVLHLITSGGYANAYTGVFGLKSGTILANLMDIARSGHFETIPSDNTYENGPANGRYPSGAWFHSVDTGCDYACQVNQYVYWGITTIEGVQSDRCSSVTGEWEPCTEAIMKQTDTGLYDLLTGKVYSFPMIAPSGNYAGPGAHIRLKNKYPDEQKMSVTLQLTGRQNVTEMAIFTGVAGPPVVITGLTSGAESSLHGLPELDFLHHAPKMKACCNPNNKHLRVNLIPYTGIL